MSEQNIENVEGDVTVEAPAETETEAPAEESTESTEDDGDN